MILGTWGAGCAGYQWGPWAGVLGAIAVRRCSAACCTRVATVTFGVDHIVSGVAINILGLGVTPVPRRARSSPTCRAAAPTQSPPIGRSSPSVHVPGSSRRRSARARTSDWFFVSDVAGVAARRCTTGRLARSR